MKKKFISIIAGLLALGVTFAFTACKSDAVTAYEIAVENGFSGTEQEWLESLKGENGRDGERGKDGESVSITVEDLYNSACANGYDKDFLQFIKEYISNDLTEYSTQDAINKCIFSVVDVIANFKVQQGYSIVSSTSSGSGVIYQLDKETGDAIIITNYHVVYNANALGENKISSDVQLYLYGFELADYAISTTYVGGSLTYDIAVLKVTASEVLKNSEATAVTVANSNDIVVGSTAIAIGNPDANGISATSGIISVDSEYITMLGADEQTQLTFRSIRVDTAINPGNSGGGLFNAKGELIGIVNAKTVDDDIENMGYAIPSNIAIAVADNILWNSTAGNTTVSKGLMGVTLTTKESKAVYNSQLGVAQIVETVVVDSVSKGALVEGVLQVGDVIVSMTHNGKEIECTRMFVIVDYMLKTRPGDVVSIKYIRNGETLENTFTLTQENFTTIV